MIDKFRKRSTNHQRFHPDESEVHRVSTQPLRQDARESNEGRRAARKPAHDKTQCAVKMFILRWDQTIYAYLEFRSFKRSQRCSTIRIDLWNYGIQRRILHVAEILEIKFKFKHRNRAGQKNHFMSWIDSRKPHLLCALLKNILRVVRKQYMSIIVNKPGSTAFSTSLYDTKKYLLEFFNDLPQGNRQVLVS